MTDLVTRLRNAQQPGTFVCNEAADRIEALEAENEEMRDLLRAMCGALENGEPLNWAAAWHDRARLHVGGHWVSPGEAHPKESERAP